MFWIITYHNNSQQKTQRIQVYCVSIILVINKPLYYDLYAVSNHFGGLGGGHYTAYGKNFHDNEWYHFDDSFVSKVKAEEAENSIVSSAAYILFYRLRDWMRMNLHTILIVIVIE